VRLYTLGVVLLVVTAIVALCALLIWGISSASDAQRQSVYQTDLALNRELYKECMDHATNGPQSTVYNDWAEVVEQCQQWAHSNSSDYFCVKNCEPGDRLYKPTLDTEPNRQ
jgi:hypothetical protein